MKIQMMHHTITTVNNGTHPILKLLKDNMVSFHSLGKVSRKGICAIFLISPKMRLCTVEYQLHKKTNSGITKTCLYNLDPLKPHFYIVKLGFTGVCIIFLISAQKHRL